MGLWVYECVCVCLCVCVSEREIEVSERSFAGEDVSFSTLYLRMNVKKCRVFMSLSLSFSYKSTWQQQKKPPRNPSRQSAHYRVIFRDLYVDEASPKTSLLPYRCNWSSSAFVIDIRSNTPIESRYFAVEKYAKDLRWPSSFWWRRDRGKVRTGRKGRLRARSKPLMTVEPRLNLHVNPGGGKRIRVERGSRRESSEGAKQGQLKLV